MLRIIPNMAILLCVSLQLFAQRDVTADYEKEYVEGFECYRLERVMARAMIGTSFNHFDHPSVRGWFPIHQNNGYYVIFWEHTVRPSVYATFVFDEKYEKIKFDTTKRPLNDYEAGILSMLLHAVKDHSQDTGYRHLPNSRDVFIPISTPYGNKVFCMPRAKEPRSYIFGNDVEYEFDRRYDPISKKVLHRKATHMCLEQDADIGDKKVYGFHHHHGEKLERLCATDIASLVFYMDKQTWVAFSIVDDHDTFVFQLPELNVLQYPTGAFGKLKDDVYKYLEALTILE